MINESLLCSNPIVFLDSGVGGLTYFEWLNKQSPKESYVYIADRENFPYGEKTPDEIRRIVILRAGEIISRFSPKLFVLACNTASVIALSALREHFTIPFVGVVPAVKPAALSTLTGKVGVLATTSTIQSEHYQNLLNRFGSAVDVINQPAPGLVELIEKGELQSQHVKDLLVKFLQPMQQAGVDKLVLGCTHYPFVKQLIETIMGNQVDVIDTGAAVARQLKNQLSQFGLINQQNLPLSSDRFFTSGTTEHLEQMLQLLLGITTKAEKF